MVKQPTRGEVLTKVYLQIQEDVYAEDFSAIEELLISVATDKLVAYLSEDK